MMKLILASVAAIGLSVLVTGTTTTPAQAHHPQCLWYKGYQYCLAGYWRQGCFWHHKKWLYCRVGGGSAY